VEYRAALSATALAAFNAFGRAQARRVRVTMNQGLTPDEKPFRTIQHTMFPTMNTIPCNSRLPGMGLGNACAY
jgi:hypothetical protein